MNESFEQCFSIQSGKQKKQRSPLPVKFVTQHSFQTPKQNNSEISLQRLVIDYSRQGLSIINNQMIWNGLLHLILDENKIKYFDTSILQQTPLLQNLSIQDNLLQEFGPIDSNILTKLTILNISKNQIQELHPSLFNLHLKYLYIQQNYITSIQKNILQLSNTLQVLGLAWGLFCQTQFDAVLENQKLKVFFTLIEASNQDLTFEQYLINCKSVGEAITQSESLNDSSINSQNEIIMTQIKEQLNYQSLDIQTQLSYINDYKQNLMHIAVQSDEIGILQYLLIQNTELANQVDLKGHTPLSLAIEKKYYRLVTLLLKYNININLGGGLQSSNLHIAALQCQVELLQDLLQLGADPTKCDIFKDTPLHIASGYFDHKRVKQFYQIILQYPLDVNHQNLKGQTCLEILIEKHNFLTIQYCNEWNAQQMRQLSDLNLFNFNVINPHTKLSLLDKAILLKNISIQMFLIDFQLVPITYQSLMLCFLPKIKCIWLYKLLKKQQLLQCRFQLLQNNYYDIQSSDDISPVIQQFDQIQNNDDSQEEEEDSMDDQLSNLSDNAPCQVSENLKQLNSWTPKFQGLRNGNLKMKRSFYDLMSNLTECIPDDEISIINQNKNIINNGNKIVTKKNMDQIYTTRLEQQLQRAGRQNLKQHNYSPNNIRMIENRNKIIKYDNYHQKRQLAMQQKQMRQIIISIQHRLRESNQNTSEIIGLYCRTQLEILDQFMNSKFGRELINIDQPLQTEIRSLKTIIQQDRFQQKKTGELDCFDLLK